MPIPTNSRLLIGQPIDSPIGRVSLAGSLHNSTGVSFSNMRVLGSFALVYLLAGEGRYADARGNDLKVAAGDLLTVFPEIPHGYGPGKQQHWDEIYIVFDGPVFNLWRSEGLLDDSRPVRRLQPTDYWRPRFEGLTNDSGQSPLQLLCRLQQFLAEIHDYQVTSARTADELTWLTRAKSLLEKGHPTQRLDLESVARQMGISYVGFRKKFTRLANDSPAHFHMKSVMNRACDLIRKERPTNRQLAAQLGFADEFHFSKRFRQIVGLSPKQYRKQLPDLAAGGTGAVQLPGRAL